MIQTSLAAKHLCEKSGWQISNLPLQKMLYLADMNFTGKFGQRLVDEPSLYHRCKAFGAKPVPNIFWGIGNIIGTREAAMIDSAWDNLRAMNPGQLVENTHWAGGAWARRYVPGARGIKIETDDMLNEYRRRIAAPALAS
jgi:uncharacterized phage-associated protein